MNVSVSSLLLPLLVSLLFSCESLRNEVDPGRLNKEAGKLVVVGFLSPQDTILAVQVSLSRPVLSTTTANVTPNTVAVAVTISNGTRFVALKYDPNYNKQGIPVYWASTRDFPIVAGQTYALTVETSAGQKVTSQCTIPAEAPTFVMQFDSAVVNDGYYYTNGTRTPFYTKVYSLHTQWVDIAGGRNYYRVASFLRTQSTTPPNATFVQPVTVQNTFFENTGLQTDAPSTDGGNLTSREGAYYRYSNNPYFGTTTISGPGGTTTTTCPTCPTIVSGPTGTTTINPSSGTGPSVNSGNDVNQYQFGSNLRFAELTVSLLHTDENYYRYHDAINRQEDVGENPFAEPVPISTNINGGLGCFAGYNRSTVVVRLK